MSVHGWILVQTDVGRARAVCDALAEMKAEGAKVLVADTVTGPYDVIARVEADDYEVLTNSVEAAVKDTEGVDHIVTCVTVSHQA